jgi:hypothetical protein
MLKLRVIIPAIIFLILLFVTSIIKNQTRIIEKKLYKLNTKIILKEKDINESQLDFYFLTSPAEIEKKIKFLGNINYIPIENSNIFLSLSSFTDIQTQLSILKKKDEKEKRKN